MPSELFAFRHAPAAVSGTCYGQSEVPVEITHEETAIRAAQAIAGTAVDFVWTSDLARCAEPAAMIGRALDVPVRIDRRLREMSMGEWEGRRWTEVERNDGDRYRNWLSTWRTTAPPSGEGLRVFEQRVSQWLAALDPGATHLVISHAGVVRALWIARGELDWDSAMQREVPPLELIQFGAV